MLAPAPVFCSPSSPTSDSIGRLTVSEVGAVGVPVDSAGRGACAGVSHDTLRLANSCSRTSTVFGSTDKITDQDHTIRTKLSK